MAGLLSGLSSLGLGNLENASIYEEPKEEKNENKEVVGVPEILEKDLVYDRSFECPVCSKRITSKVMKTGKAKLLTTDKDLRTVYDGVDTHKYDVVACPVCGYSALTRFYQPMSSVQVKRIRENISMNVHMKKYDNEIYTYEEAMERYKLALVCAIVKQAKSGEKAYICLKSAWVLRGWQEELIKENADKAKLDSLAAEEQEYLKNALEGFLAAKESESYPICGMDEITLDYLIAELAFMFKKYDISSKLVASILTSPSAGSRMKDKARDLKDEILTELKRAKG